MAPHLAPLHPHIHRRNPDPSSGTVAVVIFIFGAIVLVLVIILALLFVKKRRSAKNRESSFVPRLERQQKYGKLEEDEEGAWSADMGNGHGGVDEGGRGDRGNGYAPVHDESMGYQSQTVHGVGAKEGYR